ncbi:MAG: hypothetical protein ABIK31_01075 [candidate division WOR-3 bacterium]
MIHNNKKTIVNSVLLLTIVLTAFIIGCGTMPPEEYWTWTAQDSTQIHQIVNQYRPYFTIQFEKNDSFYPVNYIADTVARNIRLAVRTLWTKPHYWPGGITRTYQSTIIDSFIPVKDTTVTVKIREVVSGVLKIKAESSTVRLGDTTIGDQVYPLYSRSFVKANAPYQFIRKITDSIVGNDTFFHYDTITGVNTDTLIENPYEGFCERFMHFEYDDVNKTWYLSKITGGTRIFIPNYNDAPYLQLCSLATRNKAYGIWERPDTTTVRRYGIQRFYELDSIVTFAPGETLFVRATNFIPPLSLGFIHYNQKRTDLTITTTATTPRTTLPYPLEDPNQTTWQQVYLEFTPWEAVCRRGNYNALIWVLPIRVKP